jgi:hypothetical protein
MLALSFPRNLHVSKLLDSKHQQQDFNMTSQTLTKVDHSAFKTNQLVIITLNILAFLLNLPVFAVVVALAMGIGSLIKKPGFGFVYSSLLKPRGWMQPDVLDDNPEPHRFAQFVGFLFMAAGSAALFSAPRFSAGPWSGSSLLWQRSTPLADSVSAVPCTIGWRDSTCLAFPSSRPQGPSPA